MTDDAGGRRPPGQATRSDAPSGRRSRIQPRSWSGRPLPRGPPTEPAEVRRRLTTMGYRPRWSTTTVDAARRSSDILDDEAFARPGCSPGTGRGRGASTRCVASCSEGRRSGGGRRGAGRARAGAGPGTPRGSSADERGGRAAAGQEAAVAAPGEGPPAAAPEGVRAARAERVPAGHLLVGLEKGARLPVARRGFDLTRRVVPYACRFEPCGLNPARLGRGPEPATGRSRPS